MVDSGWPVDKQTTAVIFWMARKEVPLWYPNLLPCIWWTHVPLDHGDSSDLSCNHSGEDMPHGDTPKGQPEVVLVIYTQSHKLLKHLAFRTGVMNLPFLYCTSPYGFWSKTCISLKHFGQTSPLGMVLVGPSCCWICELNGCLQMS